MTFAVTQEFIDECYEATLYGREGAVERRVMRARFEKRLWRAWYKLRRVKYPERPCSITGRSTMMQAETPLQHFTRDLGSTNTPS